MATVLFDLDHTLIRFDSFMRLSATLLRRDAWRTASVLATGPLLGALLLGGNRSARWLAGSTLVWLATVRQPGPLEELMDLEVGGWFGDGSSVCRTALAALERHCAAGDRVVVVTGAVETLARRVCARIGCPQVEVVGSTLRAWRGGWVGAVHCYGSMKPQLLAERGLDPPWDVVYTDSAADLPLLVAARRPVLVNPRPGDERRVRALLPGVEVLRGD
jgi:phosphatidylglycerophosphatase C